MDSSFQFKMARTSGDVIAPRIVDGRYRLFGNEDVVIKPREKAIVKTGVRLETPPNYFAHINSASGEGINLGGVIDSDYRGDVSVIIFNSSYDNNITLKRGDIIANIDFTEIDTPELVESQI